MLENRVVSLDDDERVKGAIHQFNEVKLITDHFINIQIYSGL